MMHGPAAPRIPPGPSMYSMLAKMTGLLMLAELNAVWYGLHVPAGREKFWIAGSCTKITFAQAAAAALNAACTAADAFLNCSVMPNVDSDASAANRIVSCTT